MRLGPASTYRRNKGSGRLLFSWFFPQGASEGTCDGIPQTILRSSPSGLAKSDPLRSSSTYMRARSWKIQELLPLAGHEAKRIVTNDAEGLRRRAAHLLAMAKKARDDNYTQLADYILDRADQLFEEAKVRELEAGPPGINAGRSAVIIYVANDQDKCAF